MNSEVRERWYQALEGLATDGKRLTPQAVTMLTVLLESIADSSLNTRQYGSSRWDESEFAEIQKRAIAAIERVVPVLAQHHLNEIVDSVMILAVMPRIIPGFCPPFEDPPAQLFAGLRT